MATFQRGKPVFDGVDFHVDERLSPVTRSHLCALLESHAGTPGYIGPAAAIKSDQPEDGVVPSSQTQEEEEERQQEQPVDQPPGAEAVDVKPEPNEGGDDGMTLDANAGSFRKDMVDWSRVTHVVTESTDWVSARSAIEAAGRSMKDVAWVIPSWVTRSVLLGSKQDPTRFSTDPQRIFAGLTIYCSQDMPQADREVVYGAVQALGGQSRNVPTKDTTHIITPKADESSLAQVKDSKLGIKFVLPLWFTNSASTARLLPTLPYEFSMDSPEPLVQTTDFRLASAKKKEKMLVEIIPQEVDDSSEKRLARVALYKAVAEAQAVEDGVVGDLNEGKALPQIFDGRKVMLSEDLGVSQQTKEMLITWIRNAGGEAVDQVASCDVLIARYREGQAYAEAVQLAKTIASLTWFFHVFHVGHLTSPRDDLLHYPIPAQPVASFENTSISLSNYTGDGREYLKKLILAMGGHVITTFSAKNSHLVAAVKTGEKVSRAEEWSLPIVNHFWLEDCFKAWRFLSPAQERYCSFPLGVNYMTLLGGVSLSDEDLKERPVEASTTQMEEADVERGLQNVDIEMSEPGPSVATAPQLPEAAPAAKSKPKAKTAAAADPTPACKRGTVTPPPPVGALIDLDNIVAAGTKRAAAAKATKRLHDEIAPDMLKFQKESKRKDPVSPKDRKNARLPSVHRSSSVMRPGDEDGASENDEGSEDEEARRPKPVKRARRRSSASTTDIGLNVRMVAAPQKEVEQEQEQDFKPSECTAIHFLVTGVTLSSADVKAFEKLGPKLARNPTKTTHLICTPKLARTPKMLQALPNAPFIVGEQWLRQSLKAKTVLDEAPFAIRDRAFEEKYGCDLSQTLEKARQIKEEGGLFEPYFFYVTPGVSTDFETFKSFITSAGGQAEKWHKQSLKSAKEGEDILVIADESEKKLRQECAEAGVTVYSKELIMSSILTMEVDLEAHEL